MFDVPPSGSVAINGELFCEGHEEVIVKEAGVDRFRIRRLLSRFLPAGNATCSNRSQMAKACRSIGCARSDAASHELFCDGCRVERRECAGRRSAQSPCGDVDEIWRFGELG